MDRVKYKWTLGYEYTFYVDFDFEAEKEFRDNQGNLWLTVDGNRCTVHRNYSWDGCSPKWKFGKFVVGVWDGLLVFHKTKPNLGFEDLDQQLKYASLEHDVLCQFFSQMPDGLSRLTVDRWFLQGCRKVGFALSLPYYLSVRWYSKFVRKKLDKQG